MAPQPAIYLVHGGEYGVRREINLLVRTVGDPAAAVAVPGWVRPVESR